MKKVLFADILLCAALALLPAQEQALNPASREVPPPPVVSLLSASCDGTAVTLTWQAAPDIGGESIVLRANRPITGANFTAADRVGSVPATTTTFTDTLPDGRDYFYAILSRDEDGTFYEFFLPASNSLLVAVSRPRTELPSATASFSAFDAMTRNDAVIITWKSSVAGRPLVLYRATSPFTGMNSLVSAIVISGFVDSGTPYVDYPVPGVPYYYAVLDEETIRSGDVLFTAGTNTNLVPVEIPANYARVQKTGLPVLRPMPLPFLNPSSAVDIPAHTFSPGTERIIARLVGPAPAGFAVPERRAYLFPDETSPEAGGENYTLKKVLDSGFAAKDWPKAISELGQFLAIRRTGAATARAHFYTGEAYYFSGKYREALLEFLLAQDLYYNQSREWIQYSMLKIAD